MDPRFLKEEGPEVFNGNELLLKGALEAGCALITGYPGSPVSDLFDAAYAQRELLKSLGVLAEMANNEALAVARLNGARMAGARALAAMKSVGLHVAADGLALGNLAEPDNDGGCVVVVGDDPWIESTQINNDSRYLSQHLHMPVLEPSTFQEIKDWTGLAFTLSSAANLYITYLVTTPQADGGGTVWTHPNRRPRVAAEAAVTLDSRTLNLDKTVLLPPRTWARESTLPRRFETLWNSARRYGLDRAEPGAERSFGFVAAGAAYAYLQHALRDLGWEKRFPILKLGLTYPLDPEPVLAFAAGVDALCVVEEKRGFLETQLAEVLRVARQDGRFTRDVPVWGKHFPRGQEGFPAARGLNVTLVKEKIQCMTNVNMGPPLTTAGDDAVPIGSLSTASSPRKRGPTLFLELPVLPARTPTFCPGCPHRDSSSVFLDIQRDFRDAAYMRRAHDALPVDLIFHGETGCFTMLMFEPNQRLMHNYSGMGLGGGTGAGADPFITNKQVVFLGDSTFFHSGLLAISDSLKNAQDITYVILDNKTTAMTGHQPTPGTEANLRGERTYAQNIEAIVKAMAGRGVPVTRLDPGERNAYRALLEKTVLAEGVKIVIAEKECGLVVDRRIRQEKKAALRQNGFLAEERFIQITPEACEFCLICTQTTGCPGLGFVATADGPKLRTDPSLCVSDGACAKIEACPAFEEVIVTRRQAADHSADPVARLPAPPRTDPGTEPFYIHIAGVGGQGAGLLSAVLVQAAQAEGWRVLFSDKKGLAVRNGSVYGQLLLTRDGGVWAPGVPAGQADVVLGLDRLETLRSADPAGALRVANPARTCFVVNDAVQPTVRMLIGRDTALDVPPADVLAPAARPGGVWAADLSAAARRECGDARYANILLLGAAVQLGRLPLSLEGLERALRDNTPRADRDANLRAFHKGRALVVAPAEEPPAPVPLTATIAQYAGRLERRHGLTLAQHYRRLADETTFALNLDDAVLADVARRLYDLIGYDGIRCAGRYAKLVLRAAAHDRADQGFAITRAVIANAYKVIAIKDEFYVAHLLTREEKYERDALRFNADAARGDRLAYRHFNRPELALFGRRWRTSVRSRDWQLRWVARLKFIRDLWPAWHREEKAFRDWYLARAERFETQSADEYDLWVEIFNMPAMVRGYREIRYPQMQHARQRADALWRTIHARRRDHAPA